MSTFNIKLNVSVVTTDGTEIVNSHVDWPNMDYTGLVALEQGYVNLLQHMVDLGVKNLQVKDAEKAKILTS